jgi:predicted deacylase
LVIPNEFDGAMDEASFMPWIHLMSAFKKLGRDVLFPIESFTLEFGSEETFQMDRGEKDVLSIINYLRYKNVLQGELDQLDKINYAKLKNYQTLYSPRGGLVDFHLKPGDEFKKNDLLAVIYQMKEIDPNNPIKSCSHEIRAKADGIVINRCPSSNVHQGMELFQVMVDIYHDIN